MYIYIKKRCPPPFSTAYNSRVNNFSRSVEFSSPCQWQSIKVLCPEQRFIIPSAAAFSFPPDKHTGAVWSGPAHASTRTLTEGTGVKSQATADDHTDKTHSFLFSRRRIGTGSAGWRSYSLFKPAPFLCSRSFLLCRYPVRCRRFILAPRKMTMLLGTSLVVTQPCEGEKKQTVSTFIIIYCNWTVNPEIRKLSNFEVYLKHRASMRLGEEGLHVTSR